MPAPYIPADDITAPINLFVDGDIAQESTTNPGIKAIADREEAIRLGLVYAGTSDLLDPTRGSLDGMKRLAVQLTLGTLGALGMAAANDREIRLVEGIGTYQYRHASPLVADGYKIVDALASTGKWVLQRQNILIGEYSSTQAVAGFTNTLMTSIAAGPANTYADVIGPFVNVPNVAPGDILEAEITCHGALSGPAGSKGFCCLNFKSPALVNTVADSQHFLIADGVSVKRISLQGVTISAEALGTWEVRARAAYSAAPPTIFNVFDPMSLKVRHFRP